MIRLLSGDCRDVLPTLPEESVQCVVCSPPYYALRSYLDVSHPDKHREIGSEATPDEYLATMVGVFREVRRVLRRDGTCWVNMGSSYSSGKGSNVTDQLNRLLEGGSVFFADTGPDGVACHGISIALQHQRTPDGIFAGLLATEGNGVEQRQQDLGAVVDLFANPRRAASSSAVGNVVVDAADAEMPLCEYEHVTVVTPNLDTQPESIFTVLRPASARAGEDDKAALAVHQPNEPCVRGHVRWHSAWHTFAGEAVRKGSEDVHLVDEAVALGNRPYTLAGLLRDFRVTKASEKQLTFTSIHGGLTLAVSNVGQLWLVLRCGSIVPYTRLLEDASRFANALLPKQDIGMPWRLARALQEDGWILRSPIIWHKPNPMPESCTDRPTSAHEHVFLLTRSARYYYDADAVREEAIADNREVFRGAGSYVGGNSHNNTAIRSATGKGHVDGIGSRNLRNVWTLSTESFSGAHFATFPSALAERCIKAGTSERGCCAACGKPWGRITDTSYQRLSGSSGRNDSTGSNGWDGGGYPRMDKHTTTTGWSPGCDHEAPAVPCTVLDPFSGASTTLLVAQRLQRDAIGIELNPEYVAMGRQRIEDEAGLFADVQTLDGAPTDAESETEALDCLDDRSAYPDLGDAQPSLWEWGRELAPT